MQAFNCRLISTVYFSFMDPMGTVGKIYEDKYYTLLYTKYESPGSCGFGEEEFLVLPIVSLRELSVTMETRVLV